MLVVVWVAVDGGIVAEPDREETGVLDFPAAGTSLVLVLFEGVCVGVMAAVDVCSYVFLVLFCWKCLVFWGGIFTVVKLLCFRRSFMMSVWHYLWLCPFAAHFEHDWSVSLHWFVR